LGLRLQSKLAAPFSNWVATQTEALNTFVHDRAVRVGRTADGVVEILVELAVLDDQARAQEPAELGGNRRILRNLRNRSVRLHMARITAYELIQLKGLFSALL
jgi:hypothetical protein